MASPHAAGAAALYIASNLTASPEQVKSALQAAGNTNWNDADDPDSTKESLVNVDAF
jgi:subtilisin